MGSRDLVTATASNSPYWNNFHGDNWAPALEVHMLELTQAGQWNITNALKDGGFDEGEADAGSVCGVLDVTLESVKGGATLTYSIPHTSDDERQQQNPLLDRYAYPHVCSKYTEFRMEAIYTETRHRVVLDDDEWDRVSEAAQEKVNEAFREDVAALLHLSIDAVNPLTCTGALELEFIVKHAAGMPAATIDGELENGDYQRTWLVYEIVTEVRFPRATPKSQSYLTEVLSMENAAQSHNNDDARRAVATRHRLRFAGDAWTSVMEAHVEAAVASALVHDLCVAIGVKDVDIRVLNLEKGSLVAELLVTRPASLPRKAVDDISVSFELSETWGLLPVQDRTPLALPRMRCKNSATTTTTTTTRMRFCGDDGGGGGGSLLGGRRGATAQLLRGRRRRMAQGAARRGAANRVQREQSASKL
ncbi:46_kD_virulence_factor [Leishmania major strain Friedlin]|nr:46_kD_virulence_factor [Leishmania major strain Friedlin]